ncbi:MAG: CIA30 family protein [Candidatus Aminicenantes bacterium]|nr:MAG: CIA30 family protein [Candidatus Aminicenantes bacterium]
MSKMKKRIRRVRLWTIFALIVFLVFLAIPSKITSQDVSPAIVFKNVRVFDGESIIPRTSVLVQNGKINAVGQEVAIQDEAEVIDGKSLTLLPGLIDAHVHIQSVQNLRQSLAFGVTSVVDMFMNVKTMASIKKMQSSGRAKDMAYLISPGTLITAPGGHGTQYGLPIPTITKPEEAQEFVDARIAEGSDFIKIIYDDGSAYSSSRRTLDLATLSAVIESAHNRGKLVIVHAATLKNCMDVIEAGADGLAHLFFNNAYDPYFGRLVAKKKAFVIPTMSVLKSTNGISDASILAVDPHLSPYLAPEDMVRLKQSFPFETDRAAYEAAEKALRQLKAEAVPILAGTDAPNPGTTYGASLHNELQLLVKAGLSPLEALQSATSIPAAKFSLTGRGRIKPGYLADLLLVKGDPTSEIKATRNIVDVWKEGQKLDRKKYLNRIVKQKERVERQKKALPPENSESGWVSDFESEKIAANFGAGWSISTDAMMGGKSKAKYQLATEGAQGSKGSLLITGNIVMGSSVRWAGVMFSPGTRVMGPANLSSKRAISFWAKGEGRTYTIMIFAQILGFIPSSQTFVAGPEWKEYEFTFEKFGIEGFDIMGIFIGASLGEGEFALQIDNVRLK